MARVVSLLLINYMKSSVDRPLDTSVIGVNFNSFHDAALTLIQWLWKTPLCQFVLVPDAVHKHAGSLILFSKLICSSFGASEIPSTKLFLNHFLAFYVLAYS